MEGPPVAKASSPAEGDAVDFEEQPLVSDEERRQILSERMQLKKLNPDTNGNSALLNVQVQFEKTFEKHLRRCGYADGDILRVMPELRCKLRYSAGKFRKIDNLNKWIHDMELHFKGSEPYRIMRELLIIFTAPELGK